MVKNDESRFERGLAKLAEVDGKEVNGLLESLGDLGRYIVEFGFGDIYSREGLSIREREIATVAILTALGARDPQLRIHLRASLKAGITKDELEELIIHTVPYAGFPTAINAMNTLNEINLL